MAKEDRYGHAQYGTSRDLCMLQPFCDRSIAILVQSLGYLELLILGKSAPGAPPKQACINLTPGCSFIVATSIFMDIPSIEYSIGPFDLQILLCRKG